MSILRKNGWEVFRKNPEGFFLKALGLRLEPWQAVALRSIADSSRKRLGLVWAAEDEIDEASLVCGVVLWRALCWHRPTVIWGGRRSIATKWMNHLLVLHSASALDVPLSIISEGDEVRGVTSPTFPHWILRFDGCFEDDAAHAVRLLSNKADVLLGDFNWVSRDSLDAALEYADAHDANCTLLIGHA